MQHVETTRVDSHPVSVNTRDSEAAQSSGGLTTRFEAGVPRARVEKQVISRVRWAWSGIDDKLGEESRPVIAAALWMRTAPAQIGGLEG